MRHLTNRMLTGLLILACLAAGYFIYYQTDQDYPGKLLGQDYWGPNCELSVSGFVVCRGESGLKTDTCSTGRENYRLQLTIADSKGLPATLETWKVAGGTVTKSVSGRFYGEGTGVCYTEGYNFPRLGIKINSGSSCGPAKHPSKLRNTMFYVRDSVDYLPCNIKLPSEES